MTTLEIALCCVQALVFWTFVIDLGMRLEPVEVRDE